MKRPEITAAEFEAAYAARSGVTVDWLREHGRVVMPCDCGQDGCELWQSLSRENAIDEAKLRRPWEHRAGFICKTCRGWIDASADRVEQWMPGEIGPGDSIFDGAILATMAAYHPRCQPRSELDPPARLLSAGRTFE